MTTPPRAIARPAPSRSPANAGRRQYFSSVIYWPWVVYQGRIPPIAQLRLARLRERIQSGDDFGEIAQANSDDKGSAVQGGELGWVRPGQTVPQFEAQMNKLDSGEISQPFKSTYGWHIVQVLERRESAGGDELQRNQARETLYKRRVEEEWELWLRRLREEAYVEIRM